MTVPALYIVAAMAVVGAGATTAVAAQASQNGDPIMAWILGAVVALGAFIGVIFRWMMVRNDKMHDSNVMSSAEREKRMQDRADAQLALNETHIATLQAINTNLSSLHERVDSVPRRVAEQLDCKKR